MNRAAATLVRHRPELLDWAMVVVLSVGTVVGWALDRAHQPAWALPLDLAACLALGWRRSRPLPVLAVVVAVDVAQIVVDVPANTLVYVTLIAIYSVAAYASRRRAVVALLGTYVCIFGALLSPAASIEGGILTATAFMAAAAVLGDNIRTRRAYLAAVEERAARMERERDAQAAVAAAAERTRIAREMHDVVAHSLSVMVAQADGAGYAMDSSPDQARRAIATVAETGRLALTEMHRLLGVLRSTGVEEERTPLPGVDQLDALIARTQSAGLPVTLSVQGTPVPLSAGLSLTVYRIVQEALTNTLKHAGPTVTATVQLRYRAHDVEIEVTDNGRLAGGPRTDPMTSDGGHGLAGMRERAAVYGGSLTAGPLDGIGWRIRARLPVESPR
ncbi:MAG TPA: sensor histidine kinase [Jiangellaceae bacterium]|nr:sensor histidine kinase [Jiangellaceae bacterium]